MEFSPVGPATDNPEDAQESMFEHAAEFPGHDLTDLPEESDYVAAQERDDYAEPSLGEEREWEHAEMSGSAADAPVEAATQFAAEPQRSAHPDPSSPAPGMSAGAGPITMGDFAALEERVIRAVSLVRRERQARLDAEHRAEVLQGRILALEAEIPQLQEKFGHLEQLQQEVETLRTEREQVRQRVERLLGQLDSLEL
jgi:hypothetical protein